MQYLPLTLTQLNTEPVVSMAFVAGGFLRLPGMASRTLLFSVAVAISGLEHTCPDTKAIVR